MDHLSWQHNVLKLYTEYKNKVEEYYKFILDLAQWQRQGLKDPHALALWKR